MIENRPGRALPPLRNRKWMTRTVDSPLLLVLVIPTVRSKENKKLVTILNLRSSSNNLMMKRTVRMKVFKIGDLIVLGFDQLKFGNFERVEIRKISCITIDENPKTIINEYGSNLMKEKHDPLKTIEAKNALYGCRKENFFQVDDLATKCGTSKSLDTILEDKVMEKTKERDVSLSPVKGSQGAPEVDLSSQEELLPKDDQDADWELIEEEDGQKSEVADMEVNVAQLPVIEGEQEKQLPRVDTMHSATKESVVSDKLNPWENYGAETEPMVENGQKEDDWPAWQQVRQSKRLRDSGTSHLKMEGNI